MYLQKFDLSGRYAVVTGGGQGIGLACAEALCEAGANVTILEKYENNAEAGLDLLESKGFKVQLEICDVTDSKGLERASQILNQSGDVSVLVNNAGTALPDTAAEDMSDEDWQRVIDVNLTGTFKCCRAFGHYMLKAGFGSIVNIGSMSGYISNRPQRQVNYNASKAGVHHLTKSLAGEWAERNIRVNAVAPTYIRTPLTKADESDLPRVKRWMDGTPMRRMGEADEVASIVLFLASPASSLMTGSIVLADAGYTVW